eukprot:Gb_03466 [translate_table: standard]
MDSVARESAISSTFNSGYTPPESHIVGKDSMPESMVLTGVMGSNSRILRTSYGPKETTFSECYTPSSLDKCKDIVAQNSATPNGTVPVHCSVCRRYVLNRTVMPN